MNEEGIERSKSGVEKSLGRNRKAGREVIKESRSMKER